MAKRRIGKIITRPGLGYGDSDIEIPIAQDLLKVEGIPQRDAEVSYYSREFPLESFALEHSASAEWAQTERSEHTPATEELYRDYQKKMAPWIEKIKRSGDKTPKPPVDIGDHTEDIRDKARQLGYGEIGFTKFDRRYVYQSRKEFVRTDLPNAICLAYEQGYVETQDMPSYVSEIAQGDAYMSQAELSLKLVEFINEMGFSAQISGPAWHFGPMIPMFVEAGLGQLGVNGQLLSPHFGSRARLQVIITNAPIKYDSAEDYGIYKFCELCQVCFMRCPGKAIQAQRVWFRGVEKNKLIAKRCRPVMARYSGCGICMKVCPIQKYGMKPVMEHYVETGEVLGKGTDDLESYELENKGYFRSGKVPVFDRDFFDMPEGRLEHNLLEKLRSDLNDSTSLDDKYEHKLLLEFKDRLDTSSENKGKVVDMGMDMEF
ncbi:MAG: hypothetical protein EGP12_05905 [SAR202 cluster bacterium]|nr:MAG: hypothetical protein EGP12_05905 [SAR202 cluster bacterium]